MKFLKYIFIILICAFTAKVEAQQLPQYSQYLLNKYVINPASAGSENYFVGQTNYRVQWEGIQDAPSTYILSANGPLANQKMGIGGYIFSDITGPTRRNGINLSYAYHVKFTQQLKLSMAINAGVLSYGIDGTEITFANQNDNVLTQQPENNIFPDAGFSFYLYSPRFYFGASAPQLIQNQLDFEGSIKDPSGRLVNHYFAIAGYTFDLNSDFQLEPNALLKYVKPTPAQYELTLRSIYKETVWLGASYRESDAVVLIGGFTFQDNISFGYSYDLIQSNIANYSTGSHEIMLSIRFNDKSKRNNIE